MKERAWCGWMEVGSERLERRACWEGDGVRIGVEWDWAWLGSW